MLRHVLPRLGYAAVGLLYATVGLVAARIAFLGAKDRMAGMRGALAVLLRQPEGRAIVIAVAAGLGCFSAWRLIQIFTWRGGFITRAGWAITALGYAALAWTAVGLLLHLPRGDRFERIGIGELLPSPAGRTALRLAAGILLVAGVVAVVQGATGRLPRWLAAARSHRTMRGFVLRLARFGLAARGVVGIVMGYLLLRAVEDFNPREAREIGGSLRVLSQSPGGPLLLGVVALGLVSYGLAMWAVSLSRRPA
ncbi:MAG TPA: DUF1206 domain-containing protein [Thermoanaerobaculia bacterium]|nr:DUF1206 domain-containing protein [Thermoanaerobaculia bacterium]